MADAVQTGLANTYAKMRAPRYVQVASALRRRIQEGHWAVGDKIATLEELENEFAVARVTVRQAIEMLQDEGLLEAEHDNGTGRPQPTHPPPPRIRSAHCVRSSPLLIWKGSLRTISITSVENL